MVGVAGGHRLLLRGGGAGRAGDRRDHRLHRPRSGEPAGRQRLAATAAPTYVRYELHNPGPGGVMLHPVVEVHLATLAPERTRVFWRFANQLPDGMPEEAQQQMAAWVKSLHVEDLEGLKEHVERR